MPEVATEWQSFDQLTADTLYELLRFRQGIFRRRAGLPYPDLDGLDQGAWHLLLRVDGALAGYLRWIPGPPALVRVGGVSVDWRNCGGGGGQILDWRSAGLCHDRYPVTADCAQRPASSRRVI